MHHFIKLIIILLVTGVIFVSCKQESKSRVFSDSSIVIYEEKIEVDSKLFGLKHWVSDEEKFNEHLTIKLNSEHKYGLSLKLDDLEPDAFVRITAWKKGKLGGNLACTSADLNFYKYNRTVLEHGDNGWDKIILEAFIPPTYNGEEIKVFAMNDSKTGDAFFSDLEVIVYNRKPYPSYEDTKSFELIIDEKDIAYINKKRKKSFLEGVITKKTKKEFDAVAIIEGKEFPVSIRIKGDWLDHIQGNKWSFRIKMEEGSFRGMREFSIQQPGTRGFLNEYVLHKLLENEDVLTTRYGFIPVKINGSSLGIYAYEEHFEKGLVESRSRREGPIMKFDESAMWVISQTNLNKKKDFVSAPTVESTIITPFKKKKTMRSETLKKQFLIGQNLLNQYRYDDNPVSDLFKVDQFAKFYALTNIGRVWHPTRWHNERYYYDPLASKLEIIAFDCYTGKNMDHVNAWLEPNRIIAIKSYDYDKYLSTSPFNDPLFLESYLDNMKNYLFTDKLLKVIKENQSELNKYEEWIKREYSYYQYDHTFISDGINHLKPQYYDLVKLLDKEPLSSDLKIANYKYGKDQPLEGFLLQGFIATFAKVKVRNFHSKPLFLVGYSSKDRPEQGVTNFEEAIRFEAYKNLSEIDEKVVSCLYTPDRIYFKENLEDTMIYNVKVMPWPEPGHDSPRQNLLKNAILKSNDFAVVTDSTIAFKRGKHVFNKPIVLPPGKRVIITKGTHLDFIKEAFFLSFSPVEIKGSANNKVIIESSDGTGMGFTIIESDVRSEIEYAQFNGWNTLNYNGWILTGAVTFYESDVTISHTEFLNNNCEDALNVVRADFTLKHSLIANAFADGFDADFTTGMVYDCDFNQIGNDGIDYSGSEITIENVRIDQAGDKGISGGEASTLILKIIVISNSNIGVASKDQSKLTIENIQLINCNCGFAAYQKKMEFGPAEMTIDKCELKSVKEVYLLDKESIINLDGEMNKGDVKLDVDSLYAQ